jgi:beta-N-acetylhexosaminidase
MSIQNKYFHAQRNVPGRRLSSSPERPPQRKRSSRRPRRKRTAKALFLVLTFATLFVAFCAILWRQELVPQSHKALHARILYLPTGPFIVPPLSGKQLDALRGRKIHNVISYKHLAQMYVAHMTLDEELGQLFMAEYYDTSYSPALNTMITKLHAGGVIMYAFQMNSFAQTKHDISEMQQHAKLPLFISADEEGGFVERIQHIYGHRPGALETYLSGKLDKATQLGQSIAHDLHALGINEDLAPDVDVQLVNGPDQYLRTWGYTPQSVITYAGAYMRAVQGDGVIACIKHFPGLGAATTDAHFDLPIINRTRAQLYAVELAPFKAFIQSHRALEQPGMIMPTDVLMPAIDPIWPAELSHRFITDILRKQLGYDGVVITDALYMKGIADHWTLPQAAVLALQAGNDMLLGANGPSQMQAMLDGIKAALRSGQLSKARIDEAATRIITLKLERHLIFM